MSAFMTGLRRSFVVSAVLAAAAAGLAASATSASAEKRFFTILAVEPKGGVTTDKEPFPQDPLPKGGGYVMSQPDEKTRRWEG